MSETVGQVGMMGPKPGPGARPGAGMAATFAERETGDSLLRFLSRLSAFGLAAGREPLLKPAKPGAPG